jgi:hypothetical protein
MKEKEGGDRLTQGRSDSYVFFWNGEKFLSSQALPLFTPLMVWSFLPWWLVVCYLVWKLD